MNKKNQNALARLRIKRHLTQKELAEKSQVSDKTIQLWELKGTKKANVSSLAKVAEVLGVAIQEIIC